MKTLERLRESYEIQKKIFEEAEARRIQNAKSQLEILEFKRQALNSKIEELERRISSPKEFESFDSFRRKAERLNQQSKKSETISTITS